VKWIHASLLVSALASSGGCMHSRALERQCNQVRLDMSFAEAYRMISVTTPVCSYHRAGAIDENVPACLQRRSDPPAYATWDVPVTFVEAPDQCRIDFDERGRVVEIKYGRGDEHEWRMHKGGR